MNRRSRFEQLAECVPSFFLASDPGPSWRHSSPVTNPTTTLTATATRAACSTTAATTTTTSTYVAIASTSSASTYVAVASTSQGYASASTSLNCPTPSSSRAYLAPSPSASACRLQLSPASSKGYGTIARARGLLSPTPTFVTATPSDASFQHVRFTTHRYSPVDAAVASACSRSFSRRAASAAQLARGLLRSTIKRQRFDAFVVLCDIAFMEAIELLAREE
nr:cell wall protein DAN4-like [Penaeus vannamei]